MIGHLPAQPDTHLLLLTNDGGNIEHLRVTIVGWQHIQGCLVFPLTTINHESLPGHRLIEHPDGRISDLNGRWEYDDLAEFEAAVGEDLPSPKDPPPDPQLLRGPLAASDKRDMVETYRSVTANRVHSSGDNRVTMDGIAEGTPGVEEQEPDGDFEEPPVMTPGTGPSTSESPAFRGTSWSDVLFTEKGAFAKASFWSWPARNIVFEVSGGEPRPNNTEIEKITGAIFKAKVEQGARILKKDVPVGDSDETGSEEAGDEDYSDLL